MNEPLRKDLTGRAIAPSDTGPAAAALRATPSRLADLLWKIAGLAALVLSLWFVYRQLGTVSFGALEASLSAIAAPAWIGALAATIAAYLLLAGYDHLGLRHLGRRLDPVFVTLSAAAIYAVSHMIGATVFSGAAMRYRAYRSRGLTPGEIVGLVTFCTFTFVLGVAAVLAAVFLIDPFLTYRFLDIFPWDISTGLGKVLSGLLLLYVTCSLLPLGRLRLGRLTIVYPGFATALLQILVASAELVCAAAIVYMAMPAANPGFVTVLGVFVIALCAAMISHAPGGLGVFELVFLAGLPEMPKADLLAALLVFRLLYFVLPFAAALFPIILFETRRRR